MRLKSAVLIAVMLCLCLPVAGTPSLRAQQPTPPPLGPEEIAIVNAINRLRLEENYVPYALNPILNEAARAHALDLASRPPDDLGNSYQSYQNGEGLADRLADLGYPAYSDGYTAALIAFVTPDFPPESVVDFWVGEQERERGLIFSDTYREIGLAYVYHRDAGRHYYVILFGAQPGVLPVLVAPASNPYVDVSAQAVWERDVSLYLHNEKSHPNGDGQNPGLISEFRVSEDPTFAACAAAADQCWQYYTNVTSWTLSPGLGLRTIYVQMRDDIGRTITATAQVNLIDAPPPTNSPTSTLTATLTPTPSEPTLILYADETWLVLYVAAPQAISLTDLVLVTQPDEAPERQDAPAQDFDVLRLTQGTATSGSCYRYILAGQAAPLPSVCSARTTFQVPVAHADVFWYDALNARLRAIALYRGSETTPVAICSATLATSEGCVVRW